MTWIDGLFLDAHLTGKKATSPTGAPGRAARPLRARAPPDLTIRANVQTGFTDASEEEVFRRAGLGLAVDGTALRRVITTVSPEVMRAQSRIVCLHVGQPWAFSQPSA